MKQSKFKKMKKRMKNHSYGCFHTLDIEDKRIKSFYKQWKTLGFDGTELWNLNMAIAEFIVPRLKAFKINSQGVGLCDMTQEEWNKILDEIIWTFEFTKNYYNNDDKFNNKLWTRHEKGLKLFAKHFNGLNF